MSIIDLFRNKSILVVGAGTTGRAIARFLNAEKIAFRIFDENTSEIDGFPTIGKLEERFDYALISPGWRKNHKIIEELRSNGCELISELDLAWRLKEEISPDQKWLAVTGTNGKTTTIQMLESILNKSSFRAVACGNVGLTVLDAVISPEKYEVLAIELSSFQIEWSKLPHYIAGAILNISDDHIDWHESFEAYAGSKIKLLNSADTSIINLNDPELILRANQVTGKKVYYGLDTPKAGELGLVEDVLIDRAFSNSPDTAEVIAEISDIKPTIPHNVSNALAAAGLALSIGVPHPVIAEGLKEFKLDRHRMELVKSKDGIDWVNDSKATNPHAAAAALGSYLSCVWIAGGLAKGASMADLIRKSASRIKAAILIGSDRELIAEQLALYAPSAQITRLDMTGTPQQLLESVVQVAKSLATDGDTVLLSPACASMDQFKSYAERGKLFCEAVERLI